MHVCGPAPGPSLWPLSGPTCTWLATLAAGIIALWCLYRAGYHISIVIKYGADAVDTLISWAAYAGFATTLVHAWSMVSPLAHIVTACMPQGWWSTAMTAGTLALGDTGTSAMVDDFTWPCKALFLVVSGAIGACYANANEA